MPRALHRSNGSSRAPSPPASNALDVGVTVRVAWADGWYSGVVKAHQLELDGNRSVLKHQLQYDDGDVSWHNMAETEYEVVPADRCDVCREDEQEGPSTSDGRTSPAEVPHNPSTTPEQAGVRTPNSRVAAPTPPEVVRSPSWLASRPTPKHADTAVTIGDHCQATLPPLPPPTAEPPPAPPPLCFCGEPASWRAGGSAAQPTWRCALDKCVLCIGPATGREPGGPGEPGEPVLVSHREIAQSHARATAAYLTAAAYYDEDEEYEDEESHPLRALTGWRAGYDEELPPRPRPAHARRERCKTPGCTLFEYHSGLCTSQRIASKRERKPSAALKRSVETKEELSRKRKTADSNTSAAEGADAEGAAAAPAPKKPSRSGPSNWGAHSKQATKQGAAAGKASVRAAPAMAATGRASAAGQKHPGVSILSNPAGKSPSGQSREGTASKLRPPASASVGGGYRGTEVWPPRPPTSAAATGDAAAGSSAEAAAAATLPSGAADARDATDRAGAAPDPALPPPPALGTVKLIRCGVCEACTRTDCDKCVNCLDKRKNGGTGQRKLPCVHRRCLSKVPAAGGVSSIPPPGPAAGGADLSSAAPPVGGGMVARSQKANRCGMCDNCRRTDCDKCVNCLDKRKNGGPGHRKLPCIHRRCVTYRTTTMPKSSPGLQTAPRVPPPGAPSLGAPKSVQLPPESSSGTGSAHDPRATPMTVDFAPSDAWTVPPPGEVAAGTPADPQALSASGAAPALAPAPQPLASQPPASQLPAPQPPAPQPSAAPPRKTVRMTELLDCLIAKHMRSHPAETFTCNQCGREYASLDAVRKHARQNHPEWMGAMGRGSPSLYCTPVTHPGTAELMRLATRYRSGETKYAETMTALTAAVGRQAVLAEVKIILDATPPAALPPKSALIAPLSAPPQLPLIAPLTAGPATATPKGAPPPTAPSPAALPPAAPSPAAPPPAVPPRAAPPPPVPPPARAGDGSTSAAPETANGPGTHDAAAPAAPALPLLPRRATGVQTTVKGCLCNTPYKTPLNGTWLSCAVCRRRCHSGCVDAEEDDDSGGFICKRCELEDLLEREKSALWSAYRAWLGEEGRAQHDSSMATTSLATGAGAAGEGAGGGVESVSMMCLEGDGVAQGRPGGSDDAAANPKERRPWSLAEDDVLSLLLLLEAKGATWASLARHLPGRTVREVRERYAAVHECWDRASWQPAEQASASAEGAMPFPPWHEQDGRRYRWRIEGRTVQWVMENDGKPTLNPFAPGGPLGWCTAAVAHSPPERSASASHVPTSDGGEGVTPMEVEGPALRFLAATTTNEVHPPTDAARGELPRWMGGKLDPRAQGLDAFLRGRGSSA